MFPFMCPDILLSGMWDEVYNILYVCTLSSKDCPFFSSRIYLPTTECCAWFHWKTQSSVHDMASGSYMPAVIWDIIK